MDCNKELDEIIEIKFDEMTIAFQETIEEQFDELTESIGDYVNSSVENALQESLSQFEFVLSDGTHVIPRKQMSLTSPDKTKVLLCYGGLRVEDTSRFSGKYYPVGWGLSIQTRIDSWEIIYVYETKEEAIKALEKVKNALNNGIDSLDL